MKKLLPIIAILLSLLACQMPTPTPVPAAQTPVPVTPSTSTPLPTPTPTPTITPTHVFDLFLTPIVQTTRENNQAEPILKISPKEAEEIISSQAFTLLRSFRDKNISYLANHAHPAKGIRFAPNGYINGNEVVLTSEQIKDLWKDPVVVHWGKSASTGAPIELTLIKYFEKFIYPSDFFNAKEVIYNQPVSERKTINNADLYYPGAIIVEYNMPGEKPVLSIPEPPGTESTRTYWQSLRIVFQKEGKLWYVVAVIHDEWTELN